MILNWIIIIEFIEYLIFINCFLNEINIVFNVVEKEILLVVDDKNLMFGGIMEVIKFGRSMGIRVGVL